ncbi:MAG: hypothetical protein ABJE10_14205 [bacterium]
MVSAAVSSLGIQELVAKSLEEIHARAPRQLCASHHELHGDIIEQFADEFVARIVWQSGAVSIVEQHSVKAPNELLECCRFAPSHTGDDIHVRDRMRALLKKRTLRYDRVLSRWSVIFFPRQWPCFAH